MPGFVVAGGTDSAVVPYPPLWVIYHFVTRDTISGGVLGADQKITRKEALQVETINNAYLTFEERVKGSIEPGKLADLVVLPEDILTCAEKHIEQMQRLDDHGGRHRGVSQTVSLYVSSNGAVRRSFFLINALRLVPTLLKEPHCDPTLHVYRSRSSSGVRFLDCEARLRATARLRRRATDPRPPRIPRAQAPPADDDDAKLRPAEPDFVTINLPTTLPLPKHAMNFHLSHRFNEDLAGDSFGTQLSNLFGLDNGANIGLEFRYGVMKHLEAIVLRTSIGRTFQFTAKYDGWHQTAKMPVGISAIVSIEGENNFHNTDGGAQANFAPALGVVVSRTIGDRLALVRHADVGAQHRHRQRGRPSTPASSGSAAAPACTAAPISSPRSRRVSAAWRSATPSTGSRSKSASARTCSRSPSPTVPARPFARSRTAACRTISISGST